MSNIDVVGLKALLAKIETKKDLQKAVVETSEILQAALQAIKDAQEEYKTLLAADEEYVTLGEDIKALTKELNEGTKAASKQLISEKVVVKPADVRAYLKKSHKSVDEVDKVIQVGSRFNVLKGVL